MYLYRDDTCTKGFLRWTIFALSSKSTVTDNEHDEDTNHSVDNSMALVIVEEKPVTTPRNDDNCDDSMALVVVDSIVKEKKQEVPITNSNVKDVLDALRYARESLQASMEMRKHMRSNIAQPRLNGISC
ncbi:hypothetical protein Tco_1341655 [Tanacetum coccineum]